jgi:two-component system, sensor histidine kinase and response regulator
VSLFMLNLLLSEQRMNALTKIMVVDDDATTVTLLEMLLELDGYEVIVVRRGVDVIPEAEAKNPDIILMDFHLADMEGVAIIKDIRVHETLNAIPIIMASGMDVSEEALAAGANKFIIKPFEPSELPKLFNSLISD